MSGICYEDGLAPLDEWDLMTQGFTLEEIGGLVVVRQRHEENPDMPEAARATPRLRFLKYLYQTGRVHDL